ANSEAGQSARMTNPAGFANVRAHAEAHQRAITAAASNLDLPLSVPAPRAMPRPPATHANAKRQLETSSSVVRAASRGTSHPEHADADRSGDHWVTVDGHHVLIHEP